MNFINILSNAINAGCGMVPADPAATAATTSATDAGCLASGGVGSLFLIYAVVIGMFYLLFMAVLTLTGTLIADVLYAVVDPRVRVA